MPSGNGAKSMSTRSQIRFKFPDGQVLTYRHSDGYPSGVIPDLIQFLKWNAGRNNQYDYVIANYFYYCKRIMEEHFEKFKTDYKTGKKTKLGYIIDRKMDGNEWVLIGYGLDYQNTLHGDIEYFYDVEFIEGAPDSPFGTHMSFKITCYEVSLPDHTYPITPDQFVGLDRKPVFVLEIPDIEKYKMPSREFFQKAVDTYTQEKQAKCAHEWTEGFRGPNSEYCKNCYIYRSEIPVQFNLGGLN